MVPIQGNSSLEVHFLYQKLAKAPSNEMHLKFGDNKIVSFTPDKINCHVESEYFDFYNCSVMVTAPPSAQMESVFVSLQECDPSGSKLFQYYNESDLSMRILPGPSLLRSGGVPIYVEITKSLVDVGRATLRLFNSSLNFQVDIALKSISMYPESFLFFPVNTSDSSTFKFVATTDSRLAQLSAHATVGAQVK
jgi:hypothetical protein